MTEFMDRHFRYLKAGQKEYTEAEVRAIIDGAIQEEREACAKVADVGADGEDPYCCQPVANCIAEAIRARGQR